VLRDSSHSRNGLSSADPVNTPEVFARLAAGMTRCTRRKRSPLAFGHADVSVVVRRVSTTTLGLTELRHRQAEGGVISCQHPGNPR